MDTRFLQTLVAVVETSSLTRAANVLNVTPSAVIQRVRALEAEIGARLIRRSGHTMTATAACIAILEDAKLMVTTAQDMKSAASGRLDVGTLRVGVIHTILTSLMPEVMLSLATSNPGLELYIVPGSSIDLFDKLKRGDLDVAVMIQPTFTPPKTLEWTLLRDEAMLLLTPHWITDSDPVRILKTQPFIRSDRYHWGGRLVESYLRSLQISPRGCHELDSLDAIAILVDRGLGVALLPDWLPPWPEGINVRRIVTDGPVRSIGILSPKASRRQPLIQALGTTLLAAARRHERGPAPARELDGNR